LVRRFQTLEGSLWIISPTLCRLGMCHRRIQKRPSRQPKIPKIHDIPRYSKVQVHFCCTSSFNWTLMTNHYYLVNVSVSFCLLCLGAWRSLSSRGNSTVGKLPSTGCLMVERIIHFTSHIKSKLLYIWQHNWNAQIDTQIDIVDFPIKNGYFPPDSNFQLFHPNWQQLPTQ
jgi:hypothetical protein